MVTSSDIRSLGQMYMQAGWARARHPSHFSTWTKVGTAYPLSGHAARQRRHGLVAGVGAPGHIAMSRQAKSHQLRAASGGTTRTGLRLARYSSDTKGEPSP